MTVTELAIAAMAALSIYVARRLRTTWWAHSDPSAAAVLHGAILEAVLRKQTVVTIEHVAFAASFDPVVEDWMRGRRIDLEATRDALDKHLGPADTFDRLAGRRTLDVRFDAHAERVITLSRIAMRITTPIALVQAIVSDEAPDSVAREVLASRWPGDEPPRSSNPMVVSTSPYRAPPSHDELEVRFWNDSRTTQELVMSLLVGTFGLPAARARSTMLRVHYLGSDVIGRWPRADADRLTRAALDEARRAGAPLRITVHRPGEKPASVLARILARISRASPPRG